VSKLPAVQFYPGDWRKDVGVQSLSFHDRGIWFEILMLMHESENRGVLTLNGKPMPEDALSRILGLDKQILTTTLSSLLGAGVASIEPETGALMNRRMVRDEELRKTRSDAGKLGGNPTLLKQNPTTQVKQILTTGVKQNPTPSSSSSASITKQEQGGITPDMVARGVLTELRISTRELAMTLDDVCRVEMKSGRDASELRDSLIAGWNEYEQAKPNLTYTKGAVKFFGEGDWRNKAGWPWKEGKQPVTVRKYVNA